MTQRSHSGRKFCWRLSARQGATAFFAPMKAPITVQAMNTPGKVSPDEPVLLATFETHDPMLRTRATGKPTKAPPMAPTTAPPMMTANLSGRSRFVTKNEPNR